MPNEDALMKNARKRLSARYLVALRVYLRHQQGSSYVGRAKEMGRAALAANLATLDLAVIHERAVESLSAAHDFSDPKNGSLRRATGFFTQALVPLELDQRTTRETNRHLQQHAAELAEGNRRLQREITQRKAGEAVIRKGREQYRKLFLNSQAMQKKLRQLTRQIITAQEEERKAISRELHDQVMQTLVGINVELATLSRGATVGLATLKKKIARTQRLVENSMKKVHQFARELRPAVLDDFGLIPALHAYSKNLTERKKLKIQMTAFGGVEALGAAKRTVLFRVAQEALTNIARHAHATSVRISISEVSGAIRMEINDNGKSFDVDKTLAASSNKRLGLVGMKERVEMVGGKLAIESNPGRGTIVRADIPFSPEKCKK
ncbi:MAG TPA: sensor histidine kinase [Opitutales bacterium]|jgi:two-component system sensor histidine kinase DegS|nr:sensor histidine kinase [Opitutales bacterium]